MTPALLLLAASLQAAPGRPEPELRGLWVVRTALVSPESVDQVVADATAAGLNALFVQVRGRGDAFYASDAVARSPLLHAQPKAFDPLARLLAQARARGLAVHAWFNVLLTAHLPSVPRDNVVALHPEWVMTPRAAARGSLPADRQSLLRIVRKLGREDPDVEGFYISPSSPAVGDHLEAATRELVRRYAVDGLHLDFIRYPGPDYDYSVAALEAFGKQQGVPDLLSGPLERKGAWDSYRRDVLTNLAARLSRVAREERPALRISAAVVPDQAQALSQRFQNWPEWLQIGVLDAVCPMTYTPDRRIFRDQLEDARAHVRPGQSLWAGVGAYRLTLPQVADRIAQAREAGAAGFVLFSHESFSSAGYRELRTLAALGPPPATRAAEAGR
ncbi:MAG TPA: family 10 glycosylhydrolase [Vicinamibacteria bacterium]|nr:family 10 glycosylhydrolase [Vicinamibacteria bacterium]